MKNVVLYYGRFNPPHRGHLVLCKRLKEFASARNASVVLATSSTQDDERNPLDWDRKVVYVEEMVKPFGFTVVNRPVNSIYELIKDTAFDVGDGNITLVSGADRLKSYSGMIASIMKKYHSRGELLDVTVSASSLMERDDQDSFSATRMRKLAVEGDMQGFLANIPFSDKELGKEMYYDVREGLGLDESFAQFYRNECLFEATLTGSMSSAMDTVEDMAKRVSGHTNELSGEKDRLYIVGGAVRDILRGKDVNDLDLLTTMYYKTYAEMFGTSDIRFRGKQIVVVPVVNGEEFETGCLLKGQTLEENLSKRDITINSMAMDPATGKIVDPEHGKEDLGAHILRMTKFTVDIVSQGKEPVRVLRFLRFYSCLGWKMSDDSMKAVEAFAARNHGQLKVTTRQFEHEWTKAVTGNKYSDMLKLIDELGLTSYLEKTQPLFRNMDT